MEKEFVISWKNNKRNCTYSRYYKTMEEAEKKAKKLEKKEKTEYIYMREQLIEYTEQEIRIEINWNKCLYYNNK